MFVHTYKSKKSLKETGRSSRRNITVGKHV